MSGASRLVTGSVVATGASMDIDAPGITPRKVSVYNLDSPGKLTWLLGMADASGFREVTAGTNSFVVVAGITPRAQGFTLGAEAQINQVGNRLFFEVQD